jgi:hypothetical protein
VGARSRGKRASTGPSSSEWMTTRSPAVRGARGAASAPVPRQEPWAKHRGSSRRELRQPSPMCNLDRPLRSFRATQSSECSGSWEDEGPLGECSFWARWTRPPYGLPTYTANLCPLWGRAESASLGEDFGEAIGKSIEAASRRAIRQGPTEHLDRMLSEEQRVNDPFQTGAGRNCWRFRLWG